MYSCRPELNNRDSLCVSQPIFGVPALFLASSDDESSFWIDHAFTLADHQTSKATSLHKTLMPPKGRSRTANVKPILSLSRTEVSIK